MAALMLSRAARTATVFTTVGTATCRRTFTSTTLHTFVPTEINHRCKLPGPLIFLWQTVFIPLYVLLFVVGLPFFPAVWFYYSPFGRDDWTPGQLKLLQPLMIVVLLIGATIMTVLSKWLWIGKYSQGCYAQDSWNYQRWHLMNCVVGAWEALPGGFLQGNVLINIVYKMMGADIVINSKLTGFIRNFDLVHVGRNSVVRGNLVTGIHYAHPTRLHLASISVGDSVFLDHASVMEPGTSIGSRSKLNMLTTVITFTHMDSGIEYHGNPARPCGASPETENGSVDIFTAVLMVNSFAVPYLGFLVLFALYNTFLSHFGASSIGTVISIALAIVIMCIGALTLSALSKWMLYGVAEAGSRVHENLWTKFVEDLVTRTRKLGDILLVYCYGHSPLYNVIL